MPKTETATNAKKTNTKPATKKTTALAVQGTTPDKSLPPTTSTPVKPVEVFDHQDLSKRLEKSTGIINKEVSGISKSFCKIGFELYRVREEKLYLGQDFNNVFEYGEKVHTLQKSSISNYISICERFSVHKDGKPTAQLLPEFSGFSYGQLSIMLSLPAEVIPEITPNKTCSEIRDIKKTEKVNRELKGSGSGKNKKPDPAPAPSPAPAPAPAPAQKLVYFNVSWLHNGNPVKSTTVSIPEKADFNIHNDIGILLKNDWFDFGRDGDALTVTQIPENLNGASK